MKDHSPLPWHTVDVGRELIGTVGIAAQCKPVAVGVPAQDAAYIVKACNAYPALVEALENAEFILRKAGINPKEAGAMADSMKRGAEQAREALNHE